MGIVGGVIASSFSGIFAASVAGADAPTAAAQRLAQKNRLAELDDDGDRIERLQAQAVAVRAQLDEAAATLTAARTDLQSIATALEIYRLDNGRYPTSAQGLDALVTRPSVAPLPGSGKCTRAA